MATRTYEIKGKYTDGTDYTAGTFTVSDGTNGTACIQNGIKCSCGRSCNWRYLKSC